MPSSGFLKNIFVIAIIPSLWAQPTGFELVSGEAAPPLIDDNGAMVIRSGSEAFIQWDDFSIGSAERLIFRQPGPEGVVFNRVVGSGESQIFGQLLSNGQVYLINPNGVLIGPDARIETAGFIASGLQVLDPEALRAGELLFAGGEGSVVNLGRISSPSGMVALLGKRVRNAGLIEASEGAVLLGVGSEIILQTEHRPHLLIRARAADDSTRGGIALAQEGEIRALVTELRSSSNVFTTAIQHTGVIQATSITSRAGEVYLVAEEGSCIVDGKILAAGGAVQISTTGEIFCLSRAVVDVSSDRGAGTIWVGGHRGSLPNASATFVEQNALFIADGMGSANGGEIILWGNRSMDFYGKISICGGVEGGNGGFAEVSGELLAYEGTIDAAAPRGRYGNLLLDPSDVTISTSAASGGTLTNCPSSTFVPLGNSSIVNVTQLQNNLNSCNVTISTASIYNGPNDGSITVANNVTWSAATTLTLQANSFITVNSGVTVSSTFGNRYGTAISMTGAGNTTTAGIGVSVIGNVTAAGGDIFISGIGVGTGGGNGTGVSISGTVTSAIGDILFRDCIGSISAAGTNLHGLTISGTVSGATITAVDGIIGGSTSTAANLASGLNFSGTLGGVTTKSITINATTQTLGSGDGIVTTGGTMTVGDGGTITLVGVGGGMYNLSSSTATSNGMNINGATTLQAGNGGSAVNTIVLSGIGGSSSAAATNGVNIGSALTLTLNGTNNADSVQFVNSLGGGSANGGQGISLGANVTLNRGTLYFINCTANSSNNSHGVNQTAGNTLSAPTIIGIDCFGGSGGGGATGNNGFAIRGIFGGSSTTLINLNGGSLATSNTTGICAGVNLFSTGTIQVGDGGTITLTGTGGGIYNGSGSIMHGINIAGALIAGSGGSQPNTIVLTGIGGTGPAATGTNTGVTIASGASIVLNGSSSSNMLTFLNCVGGIGPTLNAGVAFNSGITLLNGTMQFINVSGGSGLAGKASTANYGVYINNVTVAAPAIIAQDVYGGPGVGTTAALGNNGFYISGTSAFLGNSATGIINISAGSLGAGTFDQGIYINSGTVTVGSGGTIALTGMGGGFYNGTGATNYGININGTILAGSGGSSTNTITLKGIGGTGTGGNHQGVHLTSATVNLNGTGTNDSLNFLDCVGGTGGSNNFGVGISTSLQLVRGSLYFTNITGGSGTTFQSGVVVTAAATVSAPIIIGTDIYGGPGSGNACRGFDISGALGSTSTKVISIEAGNLGTASTEVGVILQASAVVTVGDGGSIAITGVGGGLYNSSGGQNYGLLLSAGTINAGSVGGSGLNSVTLTGIGGYGLAGSNRGVFVNGAITVTLNGTNLNNSCTFLNCTGGQGAGGNNDGVTFQGAFTVSQGTLYFQNISGGSGGNNALGVRNNNTVVAPIIIGRDIYGGPTGGSGISANNGVFGSTSTTYISMMGGALGAASIGISLTTGGTVPGSFIVGDGGTIILTGVGGGNYATTAGGSVGISITGSSLISAGNGGSQPNTIILTGIGGAGLGGLNHGVSIGASTIINLNGTSSSDSLTFLNCTGGSGGNTDTGVIFTSPVALQHGTMRFQNCNGGGSTGSNSNYGVYVNNVSVTAPAIIATDLFGGAALGTVALNGGNYGFFLNGSSALLGSATLTNQIRISAGSLGLGSGEYGINVTNGTVTVSNGGTIALTGMGGGVYNATGSTNYGIFFSSATLTTGSGSAFDNSITLVGVGGAGTGGSNYGVNLTSVTMSVGTGSSVANSIAISGTGGSGSTGSNYGVNIGASLAINLIGTSSSDAVTFLNCAGGSGGPNNYGVNIGASLQLVRGTLFLTNLTGGSGTTGQSGFVLSSGVVSAPAIIGTDIFGGPGTSFCRGFEIDGTLGSGSTARISIGAGSLGTLSQNVGILMQGTGNIILGAGGALTMTGSGGGLYSQNGSANYGIWIQSTGTITVGTGTSALNAVTLTGIGGTGTGGGHHGFYNSAATLTVNLNGTNNSDALTFLNCAGGSGGSGNVGAQFDVGYTQTHGLLQFLNLTGGGSSTGNSGLVINGSTIAAPVILGTDLYGGPGSGNDFGISIINSGLLGGVGTNQIRLSGGSLGTGSGEIGISIGSGSCVVGSGGSISLTGIGGGLYSGSGSGNYGISLASATLTAGTGGSVTKSITLTGIGGTGTAGGHNGVNVTGLSVNLNGTGNSDTLTFLNCSGGSGGSNNVGMNISGAISLMHGLMQFSSISGGTGTNTNYGLAINNVLVTAPTILGIDIAGGVGSSGDYGLYINGSSGALGSGLTSRIQMSASSMGVGSTEYGIYITDSSSVVAGTIILTGIGGGLYSSTGSNNYGIYFNGSQITGTTTTFTGIGGVGTGGLHAGIAVSGANTASNSVTLLNCSGGQGGGNNYGVFFSAATYIVAQGALNFTNITGGGANSTSNHGLYLASSSVVTAPAITASDIYGGPGSGSDYGLYISSSTLGSVNLNRLVVSASSLGVGSSEIGIAIDTNGTIIVGDSATMLLTGIGGGFYGGTGSTNYGISLNGAILQAGNGGSTANLITLTGIGGTGFGGGHNGVNISSTLSVVLNGTNNGDAFNFLNCVGGNGGTTNIGVNFASAFTLPRGALKFTHVAGGGSSSNNYGLAVSGAVAAPAILAFDLSGGPGSSQDYGLYLTGSLSAVNQLQISGSSMGSGSSEVGLYLAGSVSSTGTALLTGTGGGLYSSSGTNNYGIYLNGATLSATNAFSVTGVGGVGGGGLHAGVAISGANTVNTVGIFQFLNCSGGSGGNFNDGIHSLSSSSLTMVNGTLELLHVTGGGTSSSNHNYGLHLSSLSSMVAPAILMIDLYGGPGSANDYGLYVSGATLGGPSTNELQVVAGSTGIGSNEIGIDLDLSSTLQATTISLLGVGGGLYSSSGTANYGVYLNGVALQASTLTVSGHGGTGSGGFHAGVALAGSNSVTSSIQFLNCFGGGGSTDNYGVYFNGTTLSLASGTLAFTNITGGTGSANEHGIYVANSSTVSAPQIIGSDIYSGPGSLSDFGLYVNNSSFGSAQIGNLTLTAGSLGLGTSECGIAVAAGGTISAGTLNLTGTGGGFYNSSGSGNYGIYLLNGTLSATTIQLTGVGGVGGGGGNAGVYVGTLSVPSSSSLTFLHCVGGTGGNSNMGIDWVGAVTVSSGTVYFTNVTGGGTGGTLSNVGLYMSGSLTAPQIIGVDIFGGPGSSDSLANGNNGLLLTSSGLLSGAQSIVLVAGSTGTGIGECGMALQGQVAVGTGGNLSLTGVGGGLYSSATGGQNHGIWINGATLAAGNQIFLTGIGGSGVAGANYGIYVQTALSASSQTVTFRNCVGGNGGSGNDGVHFTGGFNMVSGSCYFSNIAGGSGGTASTGNNGLYIAATVSAPTLIGTDLLGGPGSFQDYGLYIHGGALQAISIVQMSAGSMGIGSSEGGILIDSSGSVTGSTVTLMGSGGGLYSSSGLNNYGIDLEGATLGGGAVTLTGIGGTGTGGFHTGVRVVNAVANTSALTFSNCSGGSGGNSNIGVSFLTNTFTMVSGTLAFSNLVGGGVGTGNVGLSIASTVTAPNIIGRDIFGGPGTSGNYGLYVTGTLGSATASQIRIEAGSLGLGSSEYGIYITGSVIADTIALIGSGGGFYSSSASSNIGIFFSGATLSGSSEIALTGSGGTGSGGGHYGIDLSSATLTAPAITITGLGGSGAAGSNEGVHVDTALNVNSSSLTFLNCIGGNSGPSNVGVNINASLILVQGVVNFSHVTGGIGGAGNYGLYIQSVTLSAPAILGADIFGGPGTSQNYGLYLLNGTLGSSTTNRIQMSAGSLGRGSQEIGIYIDGTVTAKTIDLTGMGGGLYSSGGGTSNEGIHLESATLTAANAITLTGIGGTGGGGLHDGVNVATSFAVNSGSLTFLNCIGGTGGNSNYGVDFSANLTMVSGALYFTGVTGGGSSGTTNHYGLNLTAAVSAPIILGEEIFGGPGTNNNVGLYLSGTLGSTATTQLLISSGSLGLGSNEYGAALVSGSMVVGNGGTISLTGVGGGLYSATGSQNYGIQLSAALLSAGSGSSGQNSILLTGVGGSGRGNQHHGVNIENGLSVNLQGSNSADAVTFLNCVGGSGADNNLGLNFSATGGLNLARGTLYFRNVTGGGRSGSIANDGIRILTTVTAPNIIGSDIYGGAGSSHDVGLSLPGGTLGSSTTMLLSISAGSLGLGTDEYGIEILGGTLRGNTIALTGTGGGLYSSSSSSNHGIVLDAATLSGTSITLTGIGGMGGGGGHYGIYATSSLTISATTLTCINCFGGIGGNGNDGIHLATSLTLASGAAYFKNIVGGGNSSSNSNNGIYLSATLSAPSLQFFDILGGPGSSNDYGFYETASGVVGNGSVSYLALSAGSLGIGSNEVGIYLQGSVTAGSTIALSGTGGGFYSGSGSGNIGIVLDGATLDATTLQIGGIGGTGGGGGHHGVSIIDTLTISGATTAEFLNSIGGSGGTGNYGVNIAAAITQASGTLSFSNISGGTASSANYGVYAAASVSAPTIFSSNVVGGLGSGSDIGFYIFSGTFGGATSTTITLGASSLGIGNSENGIQVASGATVQIGSSGTLTFTGFGGGALNGTGSSNIGIEFVSGSTLTVGSGSTATLIGTGGNGSGGSHDGVYWAGNLSLADSTSTLAFLDCSGGLGGSSNIGVYLAASLTPAAGTLSFSSVQGGGPLPAQVAASTDNYGLILDAITLSAPTLTMIHLEGGPGDGNNIGLYNHGGTLGSSATTLTVVASSGGTGSTEIGVLVDNSGSLIGDTISLTGVGSGDATGSNNYGIQLSGATFTPDTSLTVTGVGGQGSSSHGISIDSGATLVNFTTTTALFTGSALEGNGISITSALDSSSGAGSLTLNGSGSTDGIYLDGSIAVLGSISLTLEGATIANGGITIDSGSSISSATGTIDLIGIQDAPILLNSSSVTSTGAAITVTGPVTLESSTPTFDGIGITFNSSIDGAFGLSANANSGTLSFLGNVGSTTPLTAFTSSGSAYDLEGDITTDNAPLDMSGGNVTLLSDVSIDTGSSSATFSGTISGAYNFVISDAAAGVFFGDDVTTSTLTVAAPITLTSDVILTTSSSSAVAMVLSDAITAANHNLTLIAATGAITLGSTVGIGTGIFTISSGSSATFGDSITAATIDVEIPAILSAPVTFDATSTTATFASTIDGDYALTIDAVGIVTLGGALGFTTPLGNVSISGSALDLNQNIYTNNSSITLSIPVTLTGDLIMYTGAVGGDISFTDTLTGGHNLTLAAGFSSDISFSAAVTGLTTLTMSSADNISAASSISAASIVQSYAAGTAAYSGALTTTGVLTLNGNAITISAGATSNAAMTLTHTGALILGPSAISLPVTGAFTDGGGGTVSLLTSITTNSQAISFGSPISLTGTSSMSAGTNTITLNRTVNGAQSLTLTAATVAFNDHLGDTTPLSSLQVTATTIDLAANQSVSPVGGGSLMTYTGDISLLGPVNLTDGGDQTLTITGTVTGNYPLMVSAPGAAISFGGAIDLSSGVTTGESLYVYAGDAVTCSSTIDTHGTYGGNVTLVSTGGDVTITSIDSHGTTGNGGSISLQPGSGTSASGSLTLPDGILNLNDSVTTALDASGSSASDGFIALAPLGRGEMISVASIAGALTVDVTPTSGSFYMGANEAMTVFGNFTLTSSRYCTFADIVVLGNIAITTGSVDPASFFISRDSVTLLAFDSSTYSSPNTHMYAGGTLTLGGGATPSGLRVGTIATLTAGDLQNGSTILNYDCFSGSGCFTPLLYAAAPIMLSPPPASPAPPPSMGSPSPAAAAVGATEQDRAEAIYRLAVLGTQLNYLMPYYWADDSYIFMGKFCLLRISKQCLEDRPIVFQSFAPRNRVR